MGKPSLLTEELADQVVTMLRSGTLPRVACEAVGIDIRTLQRWLERGRSGRERDKAYREFTERVGRARAEAEARAVAQIARAASEDWRAAAWLLERQWPERWGKVPLAELVPEPASLSDELDELAGRRLARRQASE